MPSWQRIPRRPIPYVVALVPFLVAAVRAVTNGWFPIGDAAQLYIRATDVLTAHHPWLGSASSASASLGFQVNNAGPLYFDLVAPFARTLPPGWGAVLGITTINAACVVLAGWSARRIGGATYEWWVLAAAAVLAWTMGSELLFDMFQAHALLFPFLAACVLLSGLALGQWWVLPWLAFVLTLILQTHVSYAYIVPILVVAAALSAWRHRTAVTGGDQPDHPRTYRRPAIIAGGVLVVTWFQPVWEQLFGDGEGNLSRLIRAADGTDVSLGFRNAVKLTAVFVALPPWSGRQGFRSTIEPSGIAPGGDHVVLAGMPNGWVAALALVVTLALLGVAWWWAQRRALAALESLATLAIVGVVGAVAAFSRLTVTVLGFAPHHSRWIVVIALLVYVVLAWAGLDAVSQRLGARAAQLVPAVAVAVLVVASVVNLPKYAQPHGPTADTAAGPALDAAFGQLDVAIEAGLLAQPVYFDLTNERVYAPHTSALQLHLRERGVEFRVDSEFLVRHLGERRRADGTEPTTLLQYHDVDAESVVARPPAGECLLVGVPPTGDAPGWPRLWFAVTRVGACPAARP
jgi:hypothetical protein